MGSGVPGPVQPVRRRQGAVTGHPAAYLRRSYVDQNSPGDISKEAQRATIRKLAEAEGHNGNLVEYDDWGVSADVAKSAKRTDYTRLLADMEAGRVSAVYAFDVDRLYRDPRDLIRLQDAAQRHRVRIVTTSGELAIGDGDDPAAEAFAFIGSVFGAMELKKIKKRNRAARDARLARGDALGRAPYGYRKARDAENRVVNVLDPSQPLEPVLEAFREAGSFSGAARLLNDRAVKAPRGRSWSSNVVAKVIRRETPGELVGRRVEPRVRVRGSFTLSRLLRCSCGQIMTGRKTQHRRGERFYEYTSYLCFRGRYEPDHPRPYIVTEAAILEWAKAEAARLRTPDRVQLGQQNAERRALLEQQREDLGWSVVNKLMSREAALAASARITAELDELVDQEQAIEIPAVDWAWPAPALNAALRTLWEYVELDEAMRPIRAEWRVPHWRAD